jgi:hypothetical protein
MAGDARALFAEWLLGDLHDDVLAGFQHFADKLRTARRSGMTVTTIVSGSARPAFESRTGGASAVRAAIGTSASAVWAATAAAVTSSTHRPLETGAGIAANARGISRKFFARGSGAADARSTRLAGQQNDIVLNDGRLCGLFCGVRFDQFWFGMCVLNMLVLDMFVHDVLGFTQGGGVLRAFVGGVGFEFGAIGGAVFFDLFGFFLGEFGFRGGLIFGSIEVRFFLPLFFFGFFVLCEFGFASSVNFLGFVLFFFEFGAANQSVDLGVLGGFLVLCFGKLESEGRGLLLVQFDFAPHGL